MAARMFRRPFGDGTAVVHELVPEQPNGPTDPTFVLLHGLGMGAQYWRPFADLLARHGRVLAFDLPGFGDAPEPPTVLPIAGSADALVRCLTAALPADDRAGRAAPLVVGGERVVLVGHSMGTQIAAEAAARHPGLFERLVLIAPTVHDAERTAARQVLRLLQDSATAGPRVWAVAAWSYAKVGPRWFWGKLATMLDHRIEDALPRIGVPVLVVRAEHDRVCPRSWVSRVALALPDGRMAEVPGRGHETMVTRADDVARLVAAFA